MQIARHFRPVQANLIIEDGIGAILMQHMLICRRPSLQYERITDIETAMPTVTWVEPDGEKIVAELKDGDNLMQAAKDRGISYIYGECGGCLSCATCHVYVDPEWADKLDQPDDFEISMLDLAEAAQKPNSRLSCQLNATEALDGLVLHVPEP